MIVSHIGGNRETFLQFLKRRVQVLVYALPGMEAAK